MQASDSSGKIMRKAS